jgi:hypothetical protein
MIDYCHNKLCHKISQEIFARAFKFRIRGLRKVNRLVCFYSDENRKKRKKSAVSSTVIITNCEPSHLLSCNKLSDFEAYLGSLITNLHINVYKFGDVECNAK